MLFLENVRKHRDIKLVTNEKRSTYFVSEPNYHTTKFFIENVLAIEMEKTLVLMKKSVLWGLSILDLNKTIIQKCRFDYISKENIKEHNPKWPEIPDHSYRTLIIGGSDSGETNALLNLINNKPDIDKIHLYDKDPSQAKYQLLIIKREITGLKYFNDSQAFIEYSIMDDIYKNIEECNPSNKRKILIVFDDMISDMFHIIF